MSSGITGACAIGGTCALIGSRLRESLFVLVLLSHLEVVNLAFSFLK